MCVAVCLAGCVRAGIDLSDATARTGDATQGVEGAASADAHGDDDLQASREAAAGTYSLTFDDDDCNQAKPVALTPGTTILIDTSKATNNFGLPCCTGIPDVVARLDKPVPSATFTCVGGGQYCLTISSMCPPISSPGSNTPRMCDGKTISSFSIAQPGYLYLCRDPGSPATLTVK
jgi:hypothetical protein